MADSTSQGLHPPPSPSSAAEPKAVESLPAARPPPASLAALLQSPSNPPLQPVTQPPVSGGPFTPPAAAALAPAQPSPQPGSGTPGSQSLLESLFPSGSEGGSPPRRRQATRSPSRDRLDEHTTASTDATGVVGLADADFDRLVEDEIHGTGASVADGVAEGSLPTPPAEVSNATSFPLAAGPSLIPHSHQLPRHGPFQAAHQRNASPGPSRPPPLPPTAPTHPPAAPIAAADASAKAPAAGPKPPPTNLPIVSFRIVERPPRPATSSVAQSYGYNPSGPNGGPTPFVQPPHLMRSVDPIEADLMQQVEYDMDPQDYAWVARVNDSYRRTPTEPSPTVLSDEFFTIALDRIEKEWWELTKRIPNPRSQMPSEEEACAICDDADGENSNAIVFCDGCNLAVHQDCYGVPYIPEGQWLCRKCTVSPENPVSCVMCPSEGGAFKQTTAGKWAHLLCAIWIPEAGVGNTVYMEPIDGVEAITKQRWKLKCSLCKKPGGACIQCENKSCYTAFHPTCAREAGLLGSMKTYGDTGGVLKAYCERHIPPALKATNDAKRAMYHSNHAKKTKKSARAHAKRYEVPPPLLPNMILQSVTDYVKRLPGPGARKRELVERIGRYWSLKREARRGAPLLKRLHLEPWTAADLANQKTEEERAMQLAYLSRTRQDLEQVRMLNGMVLKREKAKQRVVEAVNDELRALIKPWDDQMFDVIEKLRDSDKRKFFHEPVDPEQFPDYYKAISKPMSILTIEDKLLDDQYLTYSEFEADILLMCDNATTYNPPGHFVHKAALKTKEVAVPLLAELRAAVLASSPIDQIIRPLREDWVRHHAHLGEAAPPYPEAEILHLALGDAYEPIDSLEAHPDILALLDTPLDGGSGQTFLDSLFDFQYELEPEPEPVMPAVAGHGEGKAINGKGKERESGRPTRIRLRANLPGVPSGTADQPVRQSSRKRGRNASPSPPPPPAAQADRRPSSSQQQQQPLLYEDEDPAVAEKRRMFTDFEKGTILPEGSRRRAAAAYVPPRPFNNHALASAQQHDSQRKKSKQRREAKVIIPTSFVPNVKVPRRRPKNANKNKEAAPPPPAGPAPAWAFDDDSDLSSLSSHASEVESESEPEPSDEVLQVERRPIKAPTAYSISDDDEDDDEVQAITDDEVQEIAPPRPVGKKRAPPPVNRPALSSPRARNGSSMSAKKTAASSPITPSQTISPRKTRSSPAPTPVQARHSKLPAKQSSLRQQITAESDDSESEKHASKEDNDDDDGSLGSLFGGSFDEEDAVEALTSDTQGASIQVKARSSALQVNTDRSTGTPRSERNGLPPRAVPETVSKMRSRGKAASTPRINPRAKPIRNVEIPTTARSRKGQKPDPPESDVQATPALVVGSRSTRRTSLAAPRVESPASVAGPSRFAGEKAPTKAATEPKRPRRSQAASCTSDVEMTEPVATEQPATRDIDMPAPRTARRTSRVGPLAVSVSTGARSEEPEAGASIAAGRQASVASRPPTPPPVTATQSEGEEEQEAPALRPAKQYLSRRASSGRGRKSLPASEAATDTEEAEASPAATVSKAAKKRAALLMAAPESTTDLAFSAEPAAAPIALTVPAPAFEEEEEEFDIKGRPKRNTKVPKRFAEEVVAPIGPPPPKRQKLRRNAGVSDTEGEPQRSEEAVPEEQQPEEPVIEYPSGVPDDDEEEDPTWQHGTLVWCQCIGHPWYPAEIVVPVQIDHEDDDELEVPVDVHRNYKTDRQKWLDAGADPAARPFLVHFFDKKRVWASVPPKALQLLADNDERDRAILTFQACKNFPRVKKDVMAAYEVAWTSLEPELDNPLPPWFEEVRKQPSKPPKTASKKFKAKPPVVSHLKVAPAELAAPLAPAADDADVSMSASTAAEDATVSAPPAAPEVLADLAPLASAPLAAPAPAKRATRASMGGRASTPLAGSAEGSTSAGSSVRRVSRSRKSTHGTSANEDDSME